MYTCVHVISLSLSLRIHHIYTCISLHIHTYIILYYNLAVQTRLEEAPWLQPPRLRPSVCVTDHPVFYFA